jgi:hypothetical protein
MTVILASQLGLTDILRTDTVSAHPWNRPDYWMLKPSGGWVNPPTDYDSSWELKPNTGEVFVVNACQIQMSADVLIAPSNSMQVYVSIQTPIPNIKVTEFIYADEFLNRASEVNYYPIDNITAGACITHPFYRTVIPFAQKIFLWGSAGIDMSIGQPYKDRLGNTKLRSMIIKIADNLPYKNPNNEIIETGWSRYFVDVYRDPDYVKEQNE